MVLRRANRAQVKAWGVFLQRWRWCSAFHACLAATPAGLCRAPQAVCAAPACLVSQEVGDAVRALKRG